MHSTNSESQHTRSFNKHRNNVSDKKRKMQCRNNHLTHIHNHKTSLLYRIGTRAFVKQIRYTMHHILMRSKKKRKAKTIAFLALVNRSTVFFLMTSFVDSMRCLIRTMFWSTMYYLLITRDSISITTKIYFLFLYASSKRNFPLKIS